MKLSVLLLFFGIILFNSYLPAYAQVSLSPTAIYIHDQLNIGSLQISNGPDATREVSVSFEFGYPSADSSGNLIMVYNDTINRDRHGIGDNLRAFPRRFRIPPGGLQTVRVQVIDMNDKPDGVYWERMIITSEESPGDIEEVKVSKGIGARISYIFKQNIALFYIKGETTTGLIPGKSDFSVEEGILKVMTKLTPVGNSPFNGSVTVSVLDEAGDEVAFQKQTIAIYFESFHRMDVKLPGKTLPAGRYTLNFKYETRRRDVILTDLVQAEPVIHTVCIDIPPDN